ncbi:glucose/sorbosone family PQQ-dependent dehydrogenase [Thermomonospora umbrina]|uniref:PQQ-dependent dehydrogenase (S-GDH family) n=1 Tax=Thermomonospora umbrina TaxID=111806 RepID=A0A3D9SZ23_9ACTN|nr:glucose/sorbosone family PQQ-dependent dehydrogenase [Thermomonospora umbrina]REE96871.1 PQQ-dependent dehydrogenase (s-GDH family) [Thermomonospora umbrina]
MRRFPIALAVVPALIPLSASADVPRPDFGPSTIPGLRVVTSGLADPYEITWGPDGFLWTTEKSGRRVLRIDPRTGAKTTLLTVRDAVHTKGGQDGLLGMALHPALLKDRRHDHVYLAHTYDSGRRRLRTKIVRYTYDRAGRRLHRPFDVITGLASSVDHQSARLTFGPDGKLYYTIGDQGANQLTYYCRPNLAQRLPTEAEVRDRRWTAYQGKVLRLNIDGSIPGDNPRLGGVRSHVYSYGHRNAQGLDFDHQGRLYSSEQGPKTDDEINIIRSGGNYGWPHVVGHRDDKAYVYGNWSASREVPCASLTYSDYRIPAPVPTAKETDWYSWRFVPPVKTFHTVPSGFDFRDPKCAEGGLYYVCWPTIAPASLEAYAHRHGPGGSLLMPTLKDGTLYRLWLTADGRSVAHVGQVARTIDRYRDTAVSPDGRTVFIATDSGGITRDTLGAPTTALQHPGAILAVPLKP